MLPRVARQRGLSILYIGFPRLVACTAPRLCMRTFQFFILDSHYSECYKCSAGSRHFQFFILDSILASFNSPTPSSSRATFFQFFILDSIKALNDIILYDKHGTFNSLYWIRKQQRGQGNSKSNTLSILYIGFVPSTPAWLSSAQL